MNNTPLLTPESVGKYYRTRNGGKLKCIGSNTNRVNPTYLFKGGFIANCEGKMDRELKYTHPLDIVAEWVDEPKLVPLPEKMTDIFYNGMTDFYANRISASAFYNKLRETFGTQPSEWWMDLKKGDKVVNHEGNVSKFLGFVLRWKTQTHQGYTEITDAKPYTEPYTEPSPSEKFVISLSYEQRQLLKQIDNIEEMLRRLEG